MTDLNKAEIAILLAALTFSEQFIPLKPKAKELKKRLKEEAKKSA